jgi:L-serine deaminase
MQNSIKDEILNLANEISQLPQKDYANIKMFTENNEIGEALETLCSQIYKNEIRISIQTYKTIERIGTSMGMSESTWLYLSGSIDTTE